VPQPKPLFDGKSFAGWEGDTKKWWRIENGEIVVVQRPKKFRTTISSPQPGITRISCCAEIQAHWLGGIH
jgi:hypothetical protein